MPETFPAPQIFTGASNVGMNNCIFIASNSGPTFTSAVQSTPRHPSRLPSETTVVHDESVSLVESEVYARMLLLRKKGYPLWKPKSDERLPEEYKREGVRIGDVGILNEFGGFDYLFNACLPQDHPVNEGRVPQGFRQLHDINVDDTIGSLKEYGPGSHVASNPSRIYKAIIPYSENNPPIRSVPKEVGAGLSFSSSTSKGALLILPEGGMRVDHQQFSKFYEYASECARSWYAYINGPLARGANSIYLVTGCDKARAWGVASFIDANPGHVSLDLVPSEPDEAGKPLEYWFSSCTAASALSDSDDVYENQSGCVFLRGFKISVQMPQSRLKVGTKVGADVGTDVTYTAHLDSDELLPKPKIINSSISQTTTTTSWLKTYFTSGALSTHDEGDSSIPVKCRIYHPCDVINRWILNQNDDVDVAITHDDIWTSVIRDTEEEMPDDQELIRRTTEQFTLVKLGSYAYMDRKANTPALNEAAGSASQALLKHSYSSKIDIQKKNTQSTSTSFQSTHLSSEETNPDIPSVIVSPPSPSIQASELPSVYASQKNHDDFTFYGHSSPPSSPTGSSSWATSDLSWPSSPNSTTSDRLSEPFDDSDDSGEPYAIAARHHWDIIKRAVLSPSTSRFVRSSESLFDYSDDSDDSDYVESAKARENWDVIRRTVLPKARRQSTGDTLLPPLKARQKRRSLDGRSTIQDLSRSGFLPPSARHQPSSEFRPTQQSRIVHQNAKFPKETVDLLKAWLHRHSDLPYLSEEEGKQLCHATGLSISQVSSWMANARRRMSAPARPSNQVPFSYPSPMEGH